MLSIPGVSVAYQRFPRHLAHYSKHRHTAASEIRLKVAIASRETVTI
jgi:hypothetical protein